MAADSARDLAEVPEESAARSPARRLARADRREALLGAAASLILTTGVESVSMESVADCAGVSRPLVYKHFSNRIEILTELRRVEAKRLHRELAEEVQAAQTVEEMFRALIHASLRAAAQRGELFAALRSASGYNRAADPEQRRRDRETVRYFGQRAASEFDLPQRDAEAAVAILLTGVDSVIDQWRANKTPANATRLEETYLKLVAGGLASVASGPTV